MTRDLALRTLQQHAPALRARGVAHVRIFGSVARNEATKDSDLDVLVDFEPEFRVSLFDLVAVQQDLMDVFQSRVDVSEERAMKERIRRRAVREAVLAF